MKYIIAILDGVVGVISVLFTLSVFGFGLWLTIESSTLPWWTPLQYGLVAVAIAWSVRALYRMMTYSVRCLILDDFADRQIIILKAKGEINKWTIDVERMPLWSYLIFSLPPAMVSYTNLETGSKGYY